MVRPLTGHLNDEFYFNPTLDILWLEFGRFSRLEIRPVFRTWDAFQCKGGYGHSYRLI
jgi:hypothetical protein